MPVDMHLRILLVDDFKTMLRITGNLLRQLGFKNVDEASSGEEALDKLDETHYGLIFSDWNMQPMTGLDFLKAVRANPDTKHIPFILVTSEAKEDYILAAKKAGVDNYILKPFNSHTLKEKLITIFGPF